MGTELWEQFEKRIREEAPLFNVTVWQYPCEIKLTKDRSTGFPIQFRVKSKPDFAAGILGMAAFFDAKSTKSEKWSLRDYVFRNDARANKIHQWEQLDQANRNGNIAGYLVWFVKLRTITWVSVETIRAMVSHGDGYLTPQTAGCVSFPDDRPINLKVFMRKDLEEKIVRIMELEHV